MLSISASLLSFYCFCLSECERETNGSVRLLHVKSIYSQQRALRLVQYGYGSKWLCQAERLESGVLVLLHVKSPYSSAYSSEMRLVHTVSQPSFLSPVYTVFYWLTAPSRAKDASFIINSCKPLFERPV